MAKVKFNRISDLKKELDKRMKIATEVAHDNAMSVFEDYVFKYYDEYNPKVYVRTYQLGKEKRSLVDRGALVDLKPKKYSNGYTSYIMFLPSLMNHSKKKIRGKNGKIYTYNNHGWSEEKILHEAMVGETHGGYKNPSGDNTPIWTCALDDFHGGWATNLGSILLDNLDIKIKY